MIKAAAGIILDARAWRPTAAKILVNDLIRPQGVDPGNLSDAARIRLAASWLGRAQDATDDGGIAGRFALATGWTSSYPETTGYLIPTLLRLEKECGLEGFEERARRATQFLRAVQLPTGAFPGGEIMENRSKPSVFNTGQILNGLTTWHKHTGDEETLQAAHRAADWLVGVQAHDGAWREHVYGDTATTYTAHASCWLVEFGSHVADERYLEAGRKHLRWVLSHRDPETGWVDLAGFNPDEHRDRIASTHPIAYTLWGLVLAAEYLREREALQMARDSALSLARLVLERGELHGVLDHRWSGRGNFQCLTGNAQMALVWLRLHAGEPDPILLNAAGCVLDHARASQVHGHHPDIDGALPGSRPIWGDYLRLAYPNWAAKFFVDALLAWKAVNDENSRWMDDPPSDRP